MAATRRASRRIITISILAVLAGGLSVPLLGQTSPARTTRTPAPPAAASRTPASRTPAATRPTTPSARANPAPVAPAAPAVKTNPFLPAPIPVDAWMADLSLSPKTAPTAPTGYEPLVSVAEWKRFRDTYGVEADHLTSLRASGQFAFAEKLITDATTIPSGPELTAPPPGLRRYMLLRAASIAYRNTGGFPIADKAVSAYLAQMDKSDAVQVGALWSISNIMARTSVTPKPDRIRYDGVAAKANMQLALLLLEADQIEAANAITKQVAYHEGWLKSDPATRTMISRVRNEVQGATRMVDYLATQYQPAIRNDGAALQSVYLYGRYVKGNVALVSNLPGRVPESPLAQLVTCLEASQRGDIQAAFKAAESLRVMAASVPDSRIRSRTLYAALQLYDQYMASPLTEHDRVQRTLVRIAREGVVADGARKPGSLDPFAPPPEAPAPPGSPAPAPARPAPRVPGELPAVGLAAG